ncbi:Syntaxin-51 [Capsicum annuum]|nr:Syntaxin-51 [Capsicum annuum]
MKFTNIIVATNSTTLASALNDDIASDNNLLIRCKDLLQELGITLIHHEDKRSNRAADNLAKKGRKKQGMASFGDSWIQEYNEAGKLADDISNMISGRSSSPSTGPEAQRYSSSIRRKITILGTRLDSLQSIDSKLPGKQRLTEKEMNRRKDMLANLKSKATQMVSTLNMSNFDNRDSLLGPETKAADAMSRTTGLYNYGVVGLQRQIMKGKLLCYWFFCFFCMLSIGFSICVEQDEGFAKLEKTVMNTKHIALTVNEELDLHTRLIDTLDEHVDVTDSRLQKKGAIHLKDYRSISLIGSVYKIAAKVLAERLKVVMRKLVSNHQNAFIKDREITDAALITNEVLDWRMKIKEPGILCKLDIEKAFDQLNWSYLFSILKQMGFGERWIKWIKFSITTVKYSVLVNGSLVGFFSPQKGLRQGDLLSLFLFILAMEGLSNMLDKAEQLQWLDGFNVGTRNTVNVSHLLYADDTLVFCGADRSQVLYLNLTLLIFESLSGLYINMLKSVIFLVNEVSDLEELVGILGCNTGSLPTTYLGLSLGAAFGFTSIWDGVIEKFEKKLASWQM